jgi:hypothetical protein
VRSAWLHFLLRPLLLVPFPAAPSSLGSISYCALFSWFHCALFSLLRFILCPCAGRLKEATAIEIRGVLRQLDDKYMHALRAHAETLDDMLKASAQESESMRAAGQQELQRIEAALLQVE